ncbi:hypothetical protein C3L33_06220, partial [Rhododendron williamsianum]
MDYSTAIAKQLFSSESRRAQRELCAVSRIDRRVLTMGRRIKGPTLEPCCVSWGARHRRDQVDCIGDDGGGREMGMMFPFLENPEDLLEMMKIPKGIRPFYPSVMIQKVVIKVDEKGTEAAVISYMQLATTAGRSCPPPKRPSFIADHPFMFMIKEEMSGLIFFKGAVLNPRL